MTGVYQSGKKMFQISTDWIVKYDINLLALVASWLMNDYRNKAVLYDDSVESNFCQNQRVFRYVVFRYYFTTVA